MKPKTIGIIVGVIVLVAVGFAFFRLPQPIIELKPEKIFAIGGFVVTNTILTGWVMVTLICLGLFLGTRKLTMIPSGFQNVFEAVMEGFGNIVNGVAGEKNGRRFFPVVFILLLYIVLNNWAALTPFFNNVGITDDVGDHLHHEAELHPDEVVEERGEARAWIMKKQFGATVVPMFSSVPYVSAELPAGTTHAQRNQIFEDAVHEELGRDLAEDEVAGFVAPFFRGVNTDLNAPLAYAIWSAIFVEFWGITALGFLSYGSKFINFKAGPIGVFVGILELVSEFARIISFTFRLFGNIFAGEVLLFMMAFLVPFLLVNVFFALEIFVGLIQGFVFAMLTLVFGVMAVTSHHPDHEDQHHDAPAHGQGAAHHEAHA